MSKKSNKQKTKYLLGNCFFYVNDCYSLLKDFQAVISKIQSFLHKVHRNLVITGHIAGLQSTEKDRYHSFPPCLW